MTSVQCLYWCFFYSSYVVCFSFFFRCFGWKRLFVFDFFTNLPRGYRKFFMRNSAEHNFFMSTNVKMPTIVGILTFMNMKKSMLDLSHLYLSK